MRIVLVGADFEENLGVGMIAAVARGLGHAVRIVTYDHADQREAVARAALSHRPQVIGLSMQFQHRAHDFLALARTLRGRGFQGHLTGGGQFPSLAWREVLSPENGLDTVVFNDGEQTFTALLDALDTGRPLDEIAGLGLRTADGVPRRTAGRPLNDALDALPLPLRYRAPTRHLGVPFVPIMASRGCWGACTYCSITSTFRDARTHGGGRTFRERGAAGVAEEMAGLWHREGGPCIFCFHDDNLLKPRPEDTLARLGDIRTGLDARGVGRIGIIGKCRPDCVTPELARALRDLGVIRLYVGVENASEMGALHLNRARQTEHVDAALAACREAGIFVCYNLLIFEPDANLEDIAENIEFIRGHADHPVNFCRAEPYAGTPLAQTLAARNALTGSYLGYDYRITDDRTELLFRISAAAFRQRNFDPSGVANRYMGLGYSQVVLEHFYPELGASRHSALRSACRALTRAIALETADFLEEALNLARRATPNEPDGPFGSEFVERETALLGLRIAEADAARQSALDALYGEMAALAREAAAARGVGARVVRTVKRLALGASFAAAAVGATACDDGGSPSPDPDTDQGMGGMVVDPLPPDGGRPDYMVVDPVPPDAGQPDFMVVDPPPADAGRADFMVADPPPQDAGFLSDLPIVVDPLPQDAGVLPPDFSVNDPVPQDAGFQPDLPIVVDPLPVDAGVDMRPDVPPVVDPPPPDHAMNMPAEGPKDGPIDQWRDTTPRRAERTSDLPLWAPPDLRLTARTVLGAVEVRVEGALGAVSTRWEGAGRISGEGTCVRWEPEAGVPDAQIRVAVRSRGGVGVLAVRAKDVRG